MDIFKVIVFILHYFSFALTALFFFLKFHKKDKVKYIMFTTGAMWIIFGTIDFFLELKYVIGMFL